MKIRVFSKKTTYVARSTMVLVKEKSLGLVDQFLPFSFSIAKPLQKQFVIKITFSTERSTSTGNLLAKKIDRLRRASDHELNVLNAAISEIYGDNMIYKGKMLKKNKVNHNKSSPRNSSVEAVNLAPDVLRPRSKSTDEHMTRYRIHKH